MSNVLELLVTRWRDYQSSRAALSELMDLDPQEISRMANEYGLSSGDLQDLVAEGPHAADLMDRMLRARGLDPNDIRHDLPGVVADMAVLCSRCGVKGRCEHELDAGTAARNADDFCPNAMTMRALAL